MTGQVPKHDVVPPTPSGLTMPFWYASLQSMWIYFLVDPGLVAERLPSLPAGEGLETALFQSGDEKRALVSLDLQRYTGHNATMLETAVEVEFNLYAYPSAAAGRVPFMGWQDYVQGGDQTKTIGGYRLHVPCDNPFAVHAGQELFGEPKFLAGFGYTVPAPNSPKVRTWEYTVSLPGPGGEPEPPPKISPPPSEDRSVICKVTADLAGVPTTDTNPSPLIEYGVLAGDRPPHLVANWWSFYGPFRTTIVEANSPVSISIIPGAADHPMVADIKALIAGTRPCAVQVFESPAVSAEDGGWFPVPT